MSTSEREILERLHAARQPVPESEVTENAEVQQQSEDAQAQAGEGSSGEQQDGSAQERDGDENPVVADAGEDAPESATADSDDSGGVEPEGDVTLESLGDLATHLGVEVSDLYHLRIPITDAEGQRSEISLGEWKDSYTSAETLTKRQREAEALTAQLREEQRQHQEQTQQTLQQLQATLEAAEKHALAGLDDATLERMRADDDPNYGTYLAERMRREQALKEAREQASQQAQRLQQEQALRQWQVMQATLGEERDKLLSLPEFREWRDPAVEQRESAALSDYARSMGYSEQELAHIRDHRSLRVLQKAKAFDELQSQASAARKQVIKVGKKVAKPGAGNTKARARASDVDQARKRLRSSGSLEDAIGLMRAKRRNR